MNALRQVAVAATYGLAQLRADGYPVDQAAFEEAVQVVAALARIFEPQLSPMAPARKLPHDERMDATTVAALLGVTPAAVRLAAREGRLEGDRRGDGRWLFSVEAVTEWETRRAR